MQWLVVNTLFQETMDHHNLEDGSRETQKLDLCWKLRPVACTVNMELRSRIWSLSEDNTHSWVRISHGSNKFVMDSNNNDTEVPEDQPEEQALPTGCEGFCIPIKGKSKTHKAGNLLVIHLSIIPMNERNWIDIEPGIGLTIDGKDAWQQEEEQKGDSRY